MTDARLPERWLVDRRWVVLTDTERSGYLMALLWSVSNRTDGQILQRDLLLIPTFQAHAVPGLVASGMWVETPGGWQIADFKTLQTSRDNLDALDDIRRREREKKARQRAHKAGNHGLCTPGTCAVPGTLPRDIPRDSPQDRTGEDRRGTGKDDNEALVEGWDVVDIPTERTA